jgi:hypothetical protein
MARDWFPVESDLPDKPEVWAIAEAMNLDPDAVVGKLIRVWAWFDKHTADGHAQRVTFVLVDDKARATGFAAAMASVGWLVRSASGVTMPKFDVHHSHSAKSRLLGTVRKQAQRARDALAGGFSEAGEDGKKVTSESRGERDKNETTEQNRTTAVGSTEASTIGLEGATLAGRACLLMRQAGCGHTNPSHVDLVAALSEGVSPEALADTAREAVESGIRRPFAWAIATARGRHADGAGTVSSSTGAPRRSRLQGALDDLNDLAQRATNPKALPHEAG